MAAATSRTSSTSYRDGCGDTHVRFSLIENEERTRQALRGIKQMFAKSGKEAAAAVSVL